MPTTTPPLILAFHRPAVIAAIALLLVNDHVLKAAFPSWLTGKLSDFAGLFFFPLLLGALIELVAARFKRKAPYALPLALAFTGLLFAAIKTLPAANAWYTYMLGVQVVRDPSDLMALVMLIPAWWVGRQSSGSTQRAPERAVYAVLALGALASMATSPCWEGGRIHRLEIIDSMLYAGSGGRSGENVQQVAVADVQTLQWQLVNNPEPVMMTPPPELPYTACDSINPARCYRIDGTAKVQESTNGGQTWRTSWEIALGREAFLRRMPQPGACGKVPELRTYNLIVLPDRSVVAAMGNQGFVVRTLGGEWQRVGIEYYVYPTPTRSQDPGGTLFAFDYEFIYGGVLSLLAYTVLSVWARRMAPRPKWALHPGWFVLPWLLASLAVVITIPEMNSPAGGISLTGFVFFAALIALGLIYLVMGVLVTAEPEGTRRIAGMWAFLAVASALAVPSAVFLLWAFGVIWSYWPAAILAVNLTAAALVLLVRQWRRAALSE